MKINHLLAAFLFSPFFFSCKKDVTPGTPSSFSYELKAANTTSTLGRLAIGARTEAVSLQWTSGTASANLLKFEAKNNNGEIEFKQAVQQQIDFFAGASVLGNVTIPAGTYSEVEFKALLAPAGNAQALVLNGSFTNGSVTTPVSFQVNSPVELKAEKAAVTVAAGSSYSALNTLDLSLLTGNLRQADFSTATLTNGVIVISENTNKGIYNTMLANLQNHHGEAEVGHH